MSEFKMFMVGTGEDEEVEYVASKRMVDENGEPVAWKLKAIDSDMDEKLRKECTKKVAVNGKKNQYVPETDMDKYLAKLCVACVVYPNLNDVELQDFYGVKGAEALLKKMLKPAEYTNLKVRVNEILGYDMSMEEEVEEAKN